MQQITKATCECSVTRQVGRSIFNCRNDKENNLPSGSIADRISACISLNIDATLQAKRITLDVAPSAGVVVPMPIVELAQSALAVF